MDSSFEALEDEDEWRRQEEKFKESLRRRRHRIERIEQELNHVQSLTPAEVKEYASVARYGVEGIRAAAETIQGAWRTVRKQAEKRSGVMQRKHMAARKIQLFLKHVSQLKSKSLIRTRSRDDFISLDGIMVEPEVKPESRRNQLDLWELPDEDRVRNLQNKINDELGASRSRRERARTEDELKELDSMAKARIKEYESSGKLSRCFVDSSVHCRVKSRERMETKDRNRLREYISSTLASMWNIRGIEDIANSREMRQFERGLLYGGESEREYRELIMKVAMEEHQEAMRAVRRREVGLR
eukprot:752843-Hanusia_phi.AAC.4